MTDDEREAAEYEEVTKRIMKASNDVFSAIQALDQAMLDSVRVGVMVDDEQDELNRLVTKLLERRVELVRWSTKWHDLD